MSIERMTEIYELKKKLLRAQDPGETLNLSARLVELQREEILELEAEGIEIPTAKEPEPVSEKTVEVVLKASSGHAAQREIHALRSDIERLSQLYVKTEDEERAKEVKAQIAAVQARIAEIRSEQKAVEQLTDRSEELDWWHSMSPQAKIGLIDQCIDHASEEMNSSASGFLRAVAGFVRSNKELADNQVTRVYAIAQRYKVSS